VITKDKTNVIKFEDRFQKHVVSYNNSIQNATNKVICRNFRAKEKSTQLSKVKCAPKIFFFSAAHKIKFTPIFLTKTYLRDKNIKNTDLK